MIEAVAWGMLVFCRVGGVMMTMPPFATIAVPALARLLATAPLVLLLAPLADPTPVPSTLAALVMAIMSEVMLGIAMGFVVNLAFRAIGIAGEAMGTAGGLHIAVMFDPLTQSSPGSVGTLAVWLGTGAFLGAGMHFECLDVLADSIQAVPPGSLVDPIRGSALIVDAVGTALYTGISLAGPLLVFVFSVNLGISILGRMAPNLQLFFAIGPAGTLSAALFLLGIALPTILAAWLWLVPEAVATAWAIALDSR